MISRLTCSISDFGETLHCFDLETILMRSGVAFPDLDIDWTVPAAAEGQRFHDSTDSRSRMPLEHNTTELRQIAGKQRRN
jgi:hypothetical protein